MGEPAQTGDIRFARMGLLYGGPIKQFVADGGAWVMNATMPGHALYPGYIIRYLDVQPEGIYMQTVGVGTTFLRSANIYVGGNFIFPHVDDLNRFHFCAKFKGC